jgi:hypothetical protein
MNYTASNTAEQVHAACIVVSVPTVIKHCISQQTKKEHQSLAAGSTTSGDL